MKRFNGISRKYEDSPKEVEEFLLDLKELYKKHNMSISHEDDQGGFILDEYSLENINWIDDCSFNLPHHI